MTRADADRRLSPTVGRATPAPVRPTMRDLNDRAGLALPG